MKKNTLFILSLAAFSLFSLKAMNQQFLQKTKREPGCCATLLHQGLTKCFVDNSKPVEPQVNTMIRGSKVVERAAKVGYWGSIGTACLASTQVTSNPSKLYECFYLTITALTCAKTIEITQDVHYLLEKEKTN